MPVSPACCERSHWRISSASRSALSRDINAKYHISGASRRGIPPPAGYVRQLRPDDQREYLQPRPQNPGAPTRGKPPVLRRVLRQGPFHVAERILLTAPCARASATPYP